MLELCEDDEDEKCQGTGILICGIITTVCASVFITSGFLKKKFATFNTKSMASQEVYKSEESSHKAFLYITLYFFKSKLDIENARIAAKDYYQIHVIGPKDNFFMDNFGTNDLTAFFYDCVNDAFTIRVLHVLQQRIPNIYAICKKILTNIISKVILCVFSLALRYSDLSKDILLLYIIWLQLSNYDYNSFPMTIFWTLLSSLVITEACNMLIITMFEEALDGRHYIMKQFRRLIMTPFMPAIYMFRRLVLHLEKQKLLQDSDRADRWKEITKNLQEANVKNHNLQLVSAKLKANENILENLVSLTILILISLLSTTTSRIGDNFDQLFLNENSYMGSILVTMSFISLVMGQLQFLKANNDGCLTGIFILIPYFILGTASRLVITSY